MGGDDSPQRLLSTDRLAHQRAAPVCGRAGADAPDWWSWQSMIGGCLMGAVEGIVESEMCCFESLLGNVTYVRKQGPRKCDEGGFVSGRNILSRR